MNALATWLLLIGLISLFCAWVGGIYLSHHMPEDDADRVLHLDEVRAKRDRALAKSRTYPIGRVR